MENRYIINIEFIDGSSKKFTDEEYDRKDLDLLLKWFGEDNTNIFKLEYKDYYCYHIPRSSIKYIHSHIKR